LRLSASPQGRQVTLPLPITFRFYPMFETYFWLCLSAAAAGAINAIAGGGTLLTFPALFAALGTSAGASVMANATSTVALVPGSLAAIWGYRRELAPVRRWVLLLAVPSLAGGFIGSALVIARPESFKMAVPWLILTAALLFAVQPLVAHVTGIGRPRTQISWRGVLGAVVLQFLIAIYGGYFGAGIGILMLTSLAVMGLSDIHEMNALKSVLGTIINATSVVVFVANGTVHWPFAGAMALASVAGGYAGAHVSRRMNRRFVRWLVVGIGLTLASYYFWRQAH
jgi:uncharacterized membrane protein YfcA